MRTHFWEFQDLEARVLTAATGLHPALKRAGSSGESVPNRGLSGSVIFEPTPIYAAINQAGKILREDPEIELSEQPLEIPPEEINPDDVAIKTLLQIVNASRQKQALGVPEGRSFTAPATIAAHACVEAETYFAGVVVQMEDPKKVFTRDQDNVPYGFQIVTDQHSNHPIGIRKGVSWPTLLTFETIAINGIPYPPGSIMRADMPYERRAISYRSESDFISQQAMPIQSIERLAFMRLSAFALEPEFREPTFSEAIAPTEAYNINNYGLAEIAPPIIREWSISQIQALAASILDQVEYADYEFLRM